MNHISKTHKHFSELLKNPRVLENPEEFLGENYEAVLNFWMKLDELSEEQLENIEQSFWVFYDDNGSELDKAEDLAIEASNEVAGEDYANDAGWAAYYATNSWAVECTTIELIGMHLILEQQPLTFFQMFLEVL
jgi:hypothetical protein